MVDQSDTALNLTSDSIGALGDQLFQWAPWLVIVLPTVWFMGFVISTGSWLNRRLKLRRMLQRLAPVADEKLIG